MRYLARIGLVVAGSLILSTATVAAAKKQKAAPKKIPAAVIVENHHSVDLVELSIAPAGAETKTIVTLKQPIPAGKKATVPVKGLKSCLVSVAATFADQADSDSETDVCADKVIRFVQ